MAVYQFVEDAPLLNVKRSESGYLLANVRAARTGIQDYHGFELQRPDLKRVRVYRPESAVFDKKSMATYAGKPVTDDHPSEPVTAENWRKYGVGQIGNDDIARDGESVRVPVMLMDAAVIQAVEKGKRQVSAGYDMELKFLDSPQTTDAGEEYDAVASNIRINHLAVVQEGRAGPDHRIGDAAPSAQSTSWGARPITNDGRPAPSQLDDASAPSATPKRTETMTTKTVAVDGLDIETNDIGAQAINKLKTERQAAQDALASANTAHAAETERLKGEHASALATKDTALGAKDTEIAALQKKIPDAAALDAMASGRADLLAKAGKLAKDADFTGKTNTEVKAIALDALHGAGFSKDREEAWLNGAFDAAKVDDADAGNGFSNGHLQDALLGRQSGQHKAQDNGQSAYDTRQQNAWKGATGGNA